MARVLEDDAQFCILAGVARELRDEIGDAADLANDPVWIATQAFLGLVPKDHVVFVPAPEFRRRERRSITNYVRARGLVKE